MTNDNVYQPGTGVDIPRAQIRRNKKLPMPNSLVQGPLEAILLANELNVRMQIVSRDKTQPKFCPWITINNHTYYYDVDVSLLYARYYQDVVTQNKTFIGDALIPHSSPQHISSPWSQFVWSQPVPKTDSKTLLRRKGWCCTMRRHAVHRDLVTKHIQPLFDHEPYWFVYDQITQEHNAVVSKMFRPRIKKRSDIVDTALKVNADCILERWHQECILEIVPETSHNKFFITEKIMKPIAAQQAFVVVGHYGYLRRLRQMGFKTFHPYIDESYDSETDLETRIKMCLSAVDHFLQAGKHLDELQHIVNHNKTRLQQIQAGPSYLQHVAKKIKRLTTI